uniref:Uncharacterized protein n=1 Tax=Arundo donax TaxID=35708 RepID=A0A0A9CS53_ARUDO
MTTGTASGRRSSGKKGSSGSGASGAGRSRTRRPEMIRCTQASGYLLR